MINYIKASYKKCTQIKGQTGCMYDIYIHDGDGVRYVLGKSGDRPLIAFGINPSTATGEKSDHTISRIKSYMFKYGFDGFKMLNIYPARAKDPDDLPEVIDSDIHSANLEAIKQAIDDGSGILCAWGELVLKRNYLTDCMNDIAEIIIKSKIPTYCLGLTKTGHPYHASVRRKTPDELLRFDVESYLKNAIGQ